LKELRSLRLEGVILPSRHPNFLLGQIHLLSKQLPQAEITPKVTLVDLTDYRGVITSGSEEEFAYSLKAIEEADEIDVRGLLRQDVESTFWSIDFALLHSCRQHLPYDHNKITIAHNGKQLYFNGSPINCPDARLRIATPEPDRKSLMGDFWQVVRIFDVRVVAMVKEIEKETYFPLKKGDSCTYIGLNSETIRVTCLDLVQITEDISFRLLQVGDKEVSHLQINWEDGEGIDVNKLWLFLQKLTELEQKTPLGATIVHCLAGVGRTGTMLACMIVEQLMKNISKTESLQLNLKLLFRALRQQRPSMIQTEPQLLTVLAYFRKRAEIT
jgi:protein tyrosine phosphatase